MQKRLVSISLSLLIFSGVITQTACGPKTVAQATADAYFYVLAIEKEAKVLNTGGVMADGVYKGLLLAGDKITTGLDDFRTTIKALGTITIDNKNGLIDKIAALANDPNFIDFKKYGITDQKVIDKINEFRGYISLALNTISIFLSRITTPVAVTPKIVAEFNDWYQKRMEFNIQRYEPAYAKGE